MKTTVYRCFRSQAKLFSFARCKSRWWACWSARISIIPEPEVSGFWGGNFFPYCSPPLKVTSAKVIIICPGWYEGGVVVQPPTENCMSLDTNSKTDRLPQLRYNSFRTYRRSNRLWSCSWRRPWEFWKFKWFEDRGFRLFSVIGDSTTQLYKDFNKPWHKDPY